MKQIGSYVEHQTSFALSNPQVRFGFSSTGELIEFVKNISPEIANEHKNRRNAAWETDHIAINFTQTKSMDHAVDLVKNGWPEGLERIKLMTEFFETQSPTRKTRKYNCAGGRVNVGKMLTGNPKHMTRRIKSPSKKVITLFVELGQTGGVDAKKLIVRANVIGTIVDQLEMQGYSCELIGVNQNAHDSSRKKHMADFIVKIKSAGERLNLNDAAFVLGHPSTLRRLKFACMATQEFLRNRWSGMGYSSPAFNDDHQPEPGVFYIKNINAHNQDDIDLNALLNEQCEVVFDLIKPDGLPIDFSPHR